jgi:hypothetical protein
MPVVNSEVKSTVEMADLNNFILSLPSIFYLRKCVYAGEQSRDSFGKACANDEKSVKRNKDGLLINKAGKRKDLSVSEIQSK